MGVMWKNICVYNVSADLHGYHIYSILSHTFFTKIGPLNGMRVTTGYRTETVLWTASVSLQSQQLAFFFFIIVQP